LGFEAVERGVESALTDFEVSLGSELDARQNAVTVLRAERDGLEDEEIQGAGKYG